MIEKDWHENGKVAAIGASIRIGTDCPLPIFFNRYAQWIVQSLRAVTYICAVNGTRAVVNVPTRYAKFVFDYHKSKSRYSHLIVSRVGKGLTPEEKLITTRNIVNMIVQVTNDNNFQQDS